MFRTELDRTELDRTEFAHPGLGDSGLDRAPADPGPRARGDRVITPHGPQPPQLGDEPPVYDDGVLRITRITDADAGSRYALAGEIDEATFGGLAETLAQVVSGLGEVHLDLAGLDYSDLAGLRVLVRLAAAGHRRVVLHRVPPHLRAVLRIVGWDAAPGVELAS